MSAMERLPNISLTVITESKSCAGCDWSWNLLPTPKEVKKGVIDGVMVCVAKQARFVVNGETFPHLTSQCRSDTSLCGPKGRWWIPLKPVKIAEELPHPRAAQIAARRAAKDQPSPDRRINSGSRPQEKSPRPQSQPKVRKPYSV